MKPQRILHRPATWLLLAAASLPATPLLAQNAPVTQPPPTDVIVPPVNIPDPVVTTPPVTAPATAPTRTSPSARTPTPTTQAPAAAERRTTTRATRSTATRAATPVRAAAPTRQTAPAAAAAPAATAAAPAAAPPPVAETAAPAPVPAALPVPEETTGSSPAIWTWLILGSLLALAAFALFQMRRHRRGADADEVYHDEPPIMAAPVRGTHDEPAPMIVPATGAVAREVEARRQFADRPMVVEDPNPAAAALHEEAAAAAEEPVAEAEDVAVAEAEDVAVAEADPADVEALAASSAAPDGRPWLEFLMRPVRAGTSKDSTVVEFELTVGNTGTAPARDVRISTFMFAAGSAYESEMERMLVDPPADSALTEVDIDAGDATRVEAAMSLPRETAAEGSVLPVVVADARYRLPDGSEGRTRASFEIGIPSGEGLDPFPTDRTSGLLESVEARLHDEPERV